MLGKDGCDETDAFTAAINWKNSTLKSAGVWPSQQPVWDYVLCLLMAWLAWEVLY